jgi:hypothetical protein
MTIVFCNGNDSMNRYKRKLLHLLIQKLNMVVSEAILSPYSRVKYCILSLLVQAAISSKTLASAYINTWCQNPKAYSLKIAAVETSDFL